MFAPTRSTIDRVLVPLLAAIFLAGMLLGGEAARPARVLAENGCPPGQTPVNVGGVIVCGPISVGDNGPDWLLNRNQLSYDGLYFATDDQIAALGRLQALAVERTAANFQRPTSELAAVQTWGRADAQAELWALIVEAIRTPACGESPAPGCRTADQQAVVDWLTTVQRRHGVESAIAAGRELAVYTGINTAQYDAFVRSSLTPSAGDLEQFLAKEPVNYNATTVANATGGYCIYRSPAPFQDEYQGWRDQTCYTPCTNVLGCDDPMPTYEDFMKWGAARYRGATFTGQEIEATSRAIAMGIGIGGVAGSIVAGATLGLALPAALTGTAFASALFPVVSVAVSVSSYGTGIGGGSIAAKAAASAAAGVASASVVAAIASAVIIFITGTTVRAINLFTDLAVPGKIAQAIADARTASYDLNAMLDDPEGVASLFALFVGAASPGPRYESCNNNSQYAPNGTMCLNAPAIPSPGDDDAQLAVTEYSTPSAPTTSFAGTFDYALPSNGATIPASSRILGTWFIHSLGGSTVQSFRLTYVDWEGVQNTARIVEKDSGARMFVSVRSPDCEGDTCRGPRIDPQTCIGDGDCSVSPTLFYRAPDGSLRSLQIVGVADIDWPLAGLTYGQQLSRALNATVGNGGGTFEYFLKSSGSSTFIPIAGNETAILPVNTYTLRADFTPDEGSTLQATSLTRTLEVKRALAYVMAIGNGGGEQYGERFIPSRELEAVYLNMRSEDQASLSTQAVCTTTVQTVPSTSNPNVLLISSPPGVYPMTCAGASAANYDFEYLPGTFTVRKATLTANGPSGSSAYGDDPSLGQPAYTGFKYPTDTAAGIDQPPVCTTTATAQSPVGTGYTTSCTLGQDDRYEIVAGSGGTWEVTPRDLEIIVDSTSKTYGDTLTFDGTEFTTNGLVNDDTVTSLEISSSGSSAEAGVTPSQYVIAGTMPVGTGLDNYTITITPGELTVEPRPLTITADDSTKTYGETVTFAGTEFTTEGLVNQDTVDTVTLASNGAAATAGVAGSPYAITPSDAQGTGLGNYDVDYVDGALAIEKAALVITASSASMVLGGAVPAIVPSLDGLVAGDTADDLSSITCSTTATPASPSGPYPSTCEGGTSDDYETSYVDGTVTVGYGVTALYNQRTKVKAGSTVPIKLQLLDASGVNLGSSSLVVSLASPALVPPPGATAPTQPTGAFTWIAKNGMYQYDLKTTGFRKGTWSVRFTVAGDPGVYTLQFVIG